MRYRLLTSRQLRALIREFGDLLDRELTLGVRLRLRRVLLRMYAILKTHLGEEAPGASASSSDGSA